MRRRPALNEHTLRKIGQGLQRHFDDTVHAPLPRRLADLMRQLTDAVDRG